MTMEHIALITTVAWLFIMAALASYNNGRKP